MLAPIKTPMSLKTYFKFVGEKYKANNLFRRLVDIYDGKMYFWIGIELLLSFK